MIAIKGNTEYTIEESEKKAYVENGFDIYKDGKKIADGQGKKVSFAEYQKVKEELEKLRAKETNTEEVDKLKAEIVGLNTTIEAKDTEIAKLNTEIEAKDKEIAKLKK